MKKKVCFNILNPKWGKYRTKVDRLCKHPFHNLRHKIKSAPLKFHHPKNYIHSIRIPAKNKAVNNSLTIGYVKKWTSGLSTDIVVEEEKGLKSMKTLE